ncbi:MAG: symmetrical bis(5'-nucleosyl)-tetraphosphatase [Gammaproteobacteria bacterium]|nr:symmetrical bis(5'-nucleosyl)-tetraphosphatase [Gammaproteobacteria bacterium]
MATYAIGDIQGCYDELMALLDWIDFSPEHDLLWFTGDLVNRGPKSLEVLRFVRELDDRAIVVLGNHDLHLLAVATNPALQPRRKDTLDAILSAPDRETLLTWLRHRPLLHHDPDLGYTLVHAGLPPQWDLSTATACATELERMLRSNRYREFFDCMYGDLPDIWDDKLGGWDKLRYITNCLTRLRYCDLRGRLDLQDKGPIGSQRPGNLPWFEVPGHASAEERIIFGHWSTLQLMLKMKPDNPIFPLDHGCLWGGSLMAMRLDDGECLKIPCQGWRIPKSLKKKKGKN